MDDIMKANAYLDMKADYKEAYTAYASRPTKKDDE